ncbi:MAG: glycosyltransferase [Oscillospiraceae bacterium]
MKKKIIHIINSLQTGGAETTVKRYAINLDKNKYDLTILITIDNDKTTDIYKELMDNNINVIYIDDLIKNKQNRLFKYIKRYIAIYKVLKKADIVHTHVANNDYLLSLPKRISCFHTFHGEPSIVLKRKKHYIATFLMSKKKNFTITCLTDDMKEKLVKILKTKNIYTLSNGIELKKFSNDVDVSREKDKLGIDEDSFVIGTIGRLVEVKNHIFLIKVFKYILEKNADVRLVLVGDGPLRDQLEKEARKMQIYDKIKFLGNQRNIENFLAIMDVFVVTSLSEGQNITLIEAQAAGVPCVTSDFPATKFLRLSNKFEVINLNESIEKWSKKILSSKKPIIKYDELNQFDIKVIVQKLCDIYEDKLNDYRKR